MIAIDIIVGTAVLLMLALLVRLAGDLVSEEIRGWLDVAPRAILRLAAARLNREQREMLYSEEWLPELEWIMREAEGRPITRAKRATCFALGILMAARTVARLRTSTPPPAIAGDASLKNPHPQLRELDVLVLEAKKRGLEVPWGEFPTLMGASPMMVSEWRARVHLHMADVEKKLKDML